MRLFTKYLYVVVFVFISSKNYAQQGIFQLVNIEKYQGKEFILEGKIFYANKLANNSFAVLTAIFVDRNSKTIKTPIYNDDAGAFYQPNAWGNYQLTGKIDKKAMIMGIGAAIGGNGNYYFDDFKLSVKDGKDTIEIPLKNASFESDSLKEWRTENLEKNSTVALSTEKTFTGKQSLFFNNGLKGKEVFGSNATIGKYMDVNGVKLYYEIYGKGEPLLLIHGNNSFMGDFDRQIDTLRKRFMVIGLDSRGQGNSTGDTTRLTYELMAEDVNAFLDKLNLKNVNILGWSDGGNIALILAMHHPDKVKKMAIMGSVLFNDDTSVDPVINKLIHKQVREMDDKHMAHTDMNYRLKMLLLTEPHIHPDSLEKIKAPTLVMAGQYDVIKEKHTQLIAEKIPNSKLVIFKGADHEAPEKIPGLFNKTILDFFE
ncbi:alpha/beta fold hydrolase [Rhizosphaericola mali]|uniref:Alpha/beta hydrolase n=1 Tax=Rhizosphaericola mali TaxID=2545455 RepID=A0A5P2G3T0_9BACT|nr:alpha/beta hydrolase [Rhizosphaericola mali]QES90494.1 alpha/beta hydrolase [Rhizosphaericola mali]